MNTNDSRYSEIERQARVVLEESLRRIDGRVRSRLREARMAAVAEAGRAPQSPFWRSLMLMPAAGVAAAAVAFALVLWGGRADSLWLHDSTVPVLEDLDLLGDREMLELLEHGDIAFYEWAAAQAQAGGLVGGCNEPGLTGCSVSGGGA